LNPKDEGQGQCLISERYNSGPYDNGIYGQARHAIVEGAAALLGVLGVGLGLEVTRGVFTARRGDMITPIFLHRLLP